MEYSGDSKNYMEGGGHFRPGHANPQFGNPISSAFSPSTPRLGPLDLQYQQSRRQQQGNPAAFDGNSYQPLSAQQHHAGYSVGNGHAHLSDNSYAPLHMGYESGGIVDWNGGSRPLGVMGGGHYNMRQPVNGIFHTQQPGAVQNDWSPGLRGGQPVDSLGLPVHGQPGYGITDLSHQPHHHQGSMVPGLAMDGSHGQLAGPHSSQHPVPHPNLHPGQQPLHPAQHLPQPALHQRVGGTHTLNGGASSGGGIARSSSGSQYSSSSSSNRRYSHASPFLIE